MSLVNYVTLRTLSNNAEEIEFGMVTLKKS